MLSNNHTPLIAHTAEDSLAIYTGLYGDRHGMPISNSYRTWNPNGTVELGRLVRLLDRPEQRRRARHQARDDLLGLRPGLGDHDRRRDAGPVGPVDARGLRRGRRLDRQHGARERAASTSRRCSGRDRPRRRSSTPTPRPDVLQPGDRRLRRPRRALRPGAARSARTRKRSSSGRATPSHTAVPDLLPDEPGGYTGYQALFGHKYIAPQVSEGNTHDLFHNGFQVTNGAGNLVDLSGEPDQRRVPRRRTRRASRGSARSWPGRSLAYMADMLEADVPVVYGYIGDIHERKAGQSGCTTTTATARRLRHRSRRHLLQADRRPVRRGVPDVLRPPGRRRHRPEQHAVRVRRGGERPVRRRERRPRDPARAGRLRHRGRRLHPVQLHGGPDRRDQHEPARPARGAEGEHDAVHGRTAGCRDLRHRPAGSDRPRRPTARAGHRLADQPARSRTRATTTSRSRRTWPGSVEQEILHLVNADPDRTPTFTLFPKPDYFFGSNAACTPADQAPCASNRWDARRASRGTTATTRRRSTSRGSGSSDPASRTSVWTDPRPTDGPAIHDPNGGGTVPEFSTYGTWVDLPDIRPTLLWLAGLQDSYVNDGRVLSEILTDPNAAIAGRSTPTSPSATSS